MQGAGRGGSMQTATGPSLNLAQYPHQCLLDEF